MLWRKWHCVCCQSGEELNIRQKCCNNNFDTSKFCCQNSVLSKPVTTWSTGKLAAWQQRTHVPSYHAMHYASELNPASFLRQSEPSADYLAITSPSLKFRLFITQGADEEALWKTPHLIGDKYLSHLVKTCTLIKELRKKSGEKWQHACSEVKGTKAEW